MNLAQTMRVLLNRIEERKKNINGNSWPGKPWAVPPFRRKRSRRPCNASTSLSFQFRTRRCNTTIFPIDPISLARANLHRIRPFNMRQMYTSWIALPSRRASNHRRCSDAISSVYRLRRTRCSSTIYPTGPRFSGPDELDDDPTTIYLRNFRYRRVFSTGASRPRRYPRPRRPLLLPLPHFLGCHFVWHSSFLIFPHVWKTNYTIINFRDRHSTFAVHTYVAYR